MRKKTKRKLFFVALLVLSVLTVTGGILSGISWRSPVLVQMMMLANGTTGGSSSLVTVASTWQDWQMQMPDGSTREYRSDVSSIQLPFQTTPTDPTPIYGDLSNPIQFQIALPQGYDPLYGSFFDAINIYDQMTVYLNGQMVGQFLPSNYPTQFLTHTSYDPANQLVTLTWRILLAGSAPANQPYTLGPLDLRQQIAAFGGQPFELKVAITQTWTLFEMCQSARAQPSPCKTLYGPVNEGIVKTGTFQNQGFASTTAGFSATFPTETFAGTTSRDQNGNPVIIITHIIPTTIFTTTCGPGWNCVLGSNGTSEIITVTQITNYIPSLASLLANLLSGGLCGLAWYSQCIFGIPVWVWILLGVLILVLILVGVARRGPKRGKRGSKRGRTSTNRSQTVNVKIGK
jgi:hypothetical protein